MKFTKYIILILISLLLIGIVSAASESGGASRTVTKIHRVSLGFEKIEGLTAQEVIDYYNWVSISLIILIGAFSSQRQIRFFSILIPIFALLFIFIGWFTTTPGVDVMGIVVLALLVGVISYMKGSLKEKMGSGGPGSAVLNLFVYLIILQACIGLVNSTSLFSSMGMGDTASSPEAGWDYYEYAQLTKTIPQSNDAGGLFSDISSAIGVFADAALGVIKMLVSLIASIGCFAVVLYATFPWLKDYPIAMSFVILLQIGIYIIYTLFIINTFGKTPYSSTDF